MVEQVLEAETTSSVAAESMSEADRPARLQAERAEDVRERVEAIQRSDIWGPEEAVQQAEKQSGFYNC